MKRHQVPRAATKPSPISRRAERGPEGMGARAAAEEARAGVSDWRAVAAAACGVRLAREAMATERKADSRTFENGRAEKTRVGHELRTHSGAKGSLLIKLRGARGMNGSNTGMRLESAEAQRCRWCMKHGAVGEHAWRERAAHDGVASQWLHMPQRWQHPAGHAPSRVAESGRPVVVQTNGASTSEAVAFERTSTIEIAQGSMRTEQSSHMLVGSVDT